jgi:hypothetical protein
MLSVEQLYYNAIQRTNHRDPSRGANLASIREALELDGQAEEAKWPYLSALPADLRLWVPPATAAPVLRHHSAEHPSLIDQILVHLNSSQAVILIILIGDRFFRPNSEGVVTLGSGEPDVGYHAVIAVGHGHDPQERHVLVRNSWGAGWALGGYGWISESYLIARLSVIAVMTNPVVNP